MINQLRKLTKLFVPFLGDTIKLLRSKQTNQDSSEFIVHDLACGKGGDLTKFDKSRITHFIGSGILLKFFPLDRLKFYSSLSVTDIAEISIEHCKERYRLFEKNFSAEFHTIDCTRKLIKDRLRDNNIKFDMTSCQFSFHYCFESYEQVCNMVRNASENLKVGGIFCGTIPDSMEIMKRLKDCGTNEYGNDVYSIRFDQTYDEIMSDGAPLFGLKYYFHLDEVVDCPEFLVYFPVMEEICKSFGLKLIFKKRFDEFYEENHCGDENSNLLNFMEALEKYPPRDRERSMGRPSDYKHIRQYLSENVLSPSNLKSLGTLSKSEWECITLYLVFSFKKIL